MNLEEQNKLDAERRQADIATRYEWEIKSGCRDPITKLPIDPNRPVVKKEELEFTPEDCR